MKTSKIVMMVFGAVLVVPLAIRILVWLVGRIIRIVLAMMHYNDKKIKEEAVERREDEAE